MSEPLGKSLADWLAEPPPLPNVDDVIPLWLNTEGKRRARNVAERLAKAENAQQRAAVQALIDRTKSAETRAADALRRNDNLQQTLDRQARLRTQAEAELQAVRGNLSIIVQVATQVAAAAGMSATGVDYRHEYRQDRGTVGQIQVEYWLQGSRAQVPVLHDVSQGELTYGTGREEAHFALSGHGGISEDWQRALRNYHWKSNDCQYCGRRANH